MKKAYMILDLQFGSTGKGSLAGYLAATRGPDVIVTAWGPNAGHTYIDENGTEYIHRMLANGVVSPNLKTILIGPGSVIDPEILYQEIKSCQHLLKGKQIVVHPIAAIVMPHHLEQEKANVSIGSTMKGTGAAIIQRIARNPHDMNVAYHAFPLDVMLKIQKLGVSIVCNTLEYASAMDAAKLIQIEGAQGYSLSIYHGFYPYCTSRDVTPAQVLADCAIPYSIKPSIYGTLRTYPIRVSNRYDIHGKEIGTSGPYYPDQNELTWEDLGMKPELTTVTKLPRRVFTFSMTQTLKACGQCGPTALFLNFVNYMSGYDATNLAERIEHATGVPIMWYGVGPNHEDVLTPEQFLIRGHQS